MGHRKHTWMNKKDANVRIYENCLNIEGNDSKRAYIKYKQVMGKLKAKEKLEDEDAYNELT